MKCTPIPGGFVCGPRTPRKRCSTPSCDGTATALCDYPVTRKGKEGTCDAKLCSRCRRPQAAPGTDLCQAHDRMSKAAVAPDGAPAAPQPGDHRVHILTGAHLYVVHVAEHEGATHVTFSQNRPGPGRCNGPLQTVPLDKWLAKTRAP